MSLAGLSALEADVKKAVADGAVREVTVAPGTSLQWMAHRRGTRAALLRPARWDGAKPFPAFEFVVDTLTRQLGMSTADPRTSIPTIAQPARMREGVSTAPCVLQIRIGSGTSPGGGSDGNPIVGRSGGGSMFGGRCTSGNSGSSGGTMGGDGGCGAPGGEGSIGVGTVTCVFMNVSRLTWLPSWHRDCCAQSEETRR